MTTLRVNEITDAAGTSAPDFKDGITYKGSALSSLNGYEYTSSATEPTSPNDGALWWDTTNSKPKIYINGEWKTLALAGTDVTLLNWYGDRAVVAGGLGVSGGLVRYDVIEYFSISALSGNATDFGDLIAGQSNTVGCSDSTYGLFTGGYDGTASLGTIDYITISTTGNASDFGDLSKNRNQAGALSNYTYGVFAGGIDTSQITEDTIDYVTISTPANAVDFGNLSLTRRNHPAGCSNGTRGVFGGGYHSSSQTNTIDYITIDTPSDATDFGDLTVGRYTLCSVFDKTRGVFSPGVNDRTTMDYITIATTGNATDFGDTLSAVHGRAGSSDGTYGTFSGGNTGTTSINAIEYITIQTTGNGTDFGDLSATKVNLAGTSGDAS